MKYVIGVYDAGDLTLHQCRAWDEHTALGNLKEKLQYSDDAIVSILKISSVGYPNGFIDALAAVRDGQPPCLEAIDPKYYLHEDPRFGYEGSNDST